MIQVNLYDSKIGLGIEAIKTNLICSGFYEKSSVIEPVLGPVGKRLNISIEDAVDLIEMSVFQNNADLSKKAVFDFFINGFSTQMENLKK